MRVRAALATLTASAVALSGCASAAKPTVLGRNVTVKIEGSRPLKGELLAVQDGQLLLQEPDGTEQVPLSAVREVVVRRHDWDGRRGLLWTLLGGVSTGGALAASCSKVSDGCGAVAATTIGLWLLVGGAASLAMDSASRHRVERPTEERLRPLSRFPQGLPPAFDLKRRGAGLPSGPNPDGTGSGTRPAAEDQEGGAP